MAEDYQELEEQSISVVQGDSHEPPANKVVINENSPEAIKQKRWVLIKAILGEMLCTFLFIYIVCATSANFARLKTVNNPVVGALCTGFASVALIYSFADVSGAHFNPAVTFATIVTRKTGLAKGLMYIAAQLIGAVFSSLILLVTFPENYEKGNVAAHVAIVPAQDANDANAFLIELILTFILVYVIFAVAFDTVDNKNVQVVNTPGGGKQKKGGNNLTIYTTSGATKAGFAPIAIGFTLGFLSFMGGSVSGGAFNPARVFGPALVGNVWTKHWLYWIADFLGAGVAGYTQRFFATGANKMQ